MDFSFNAKTYADLFHRTMAVYLQQAEEPTKVMGEQGGNSLPELIAAMDQAIDVMARADADSVVQKDMSEESIGRLEEKDITQIGQYALDILEAIIAYVQNSSAEPNREPARDLWRLTIPVSLWVARYGGKLSQVDMLVNSLAGYANEVTDKHSLAQLASTIREIIDACDDEIRRDIEQTNMMRPWRILNINYGIVATRSHQPELIAQAYDALISNLPHDARQFFKEGMQQMDIVGYPDEVREVVERYNKMWGTEGVLH